MPAPVKFVGGSYELARKKVDAQRTINMCPAPIESGGGAAPVFLQSIPGLNEFSPYIPPEPPVPPPFDPYWSDVILLLNAQGDISYDAAQFHIVCTPFGTMRFDTELELFGYPTYTMDAAPSGGYLQGASDQFIGDAQGSGEWCLEQWVYPKAPGASNIYTWQYICNTQQAYFADQSLSASVLMTAFGSLTGYGAQTTPGSVPLNTWSHIAFVRDNSDPTFTFMKIYVNGILNSVSDHIAKENTAAIPSATFRRFIGYNSLGSSGNFQGLRITRNTARYYGNFAVPTAPWPTQGPP